MVKFATLDHNPDASNSQQETLTGLKYGQRYFVNVRSVRTVRGLSEETENSRDPEFTTRCLGMFIYKPYSNRWVCHICMVKMFMNSILSSCLLPNVTLLPWPNLCSMFNSCTETNNATNNVTDSTHQPYKFTVQIETCTVVLCVLVAATNSGGSSGGGSGGLIDPSPWPCGFLLCCLPRHPSASIEGLWLWRVFEHQNTSETGVYTVSNISGRLKGATAVWMFIKNKFHGAAWQRVAIPIIYLTSLSILKIHYGISVDTEAAVDTFAAKNSRKMRMSVTQ